MSTRDRTSRRLRGRPWMLGVALAAVAGLARAEDRVAQAPTRAALDQGRELFLREWLPADARSHGGDGLGPVFNDSSCVACHNAGAPGGGGPNSKNVDIISAAANMVSQFVQESQPALVPAEPTFLDRTVEALFGIEPPRRLMPSPADQPRLIRHKPDRAPLIERHPGFRTANSVVVHRFATEPGYEQWRSGLLGMNVFGGMGMGMGMGMPGQLDPDSEIGQHRMMAQNEANFLQAQQQVGEFALLRSQRNPTALFGAGLIDAIPESVLVEQAKARFPEFPEIAGRVSQLKDGRIGRFGWKAQTPSLEDFVLTACAVELGLEVPGHAQGGLPTGPRETAKGLDLTAEECASLTAYVKHLPKPRQLNADHPDIEAGRDLFGRIGCANCHTPKLGDVEGLYSDLLLHDMGQDLGDTGQYGVFVPDSSEPEIDDDGANAPGGIAQAVEPSAPAPPVEGAPAISDAPPVAPSEAPAVTTITTVPADPALAQGGLMVRNEVAQVAAPVQFQGSFMMSGMAGNPFGIAPNRPKDGPASRQEWRTPPLWGLRDSGPYMHDGRAATLERAIALHGGEASRPARNYFALKPAERQKVQAFLKALAAPTDDGLAVAAK
jgi:CxxC motif-containing protein (DUF1111 family)